ncbi:TonB-dependent receptor plug domain-containing protein [Elizabethkingia argentiflava]|uniref:TonB-dependent receptor plug domain-containing protein n=1 Tax=Elizabethkingia argenteiflava TaxID=2681556 RepID=A0A845PZL3_9FLAO|nr:TonB-dependent receptor [Elizabethkingia argenteiflava]NAW51520.1 TonB-dependent receptor plug domain-containing protein [Elizabethkingia argenteiflava]
MKSKFILLLLVAINTLAFCQNTFKAIIRDQETKQPLSGVVVQLKKLTISAISDATGQIILNHIPNGQQSIEYSFSEYETKTEIYQFPVSICDTIIVHLKSSEHQHEDEIEEVRISSTRSTRTIKDIPTRIEFIAGEELEEKGNMRSGDIRLLLSESTGIQTQQTSAISANASIRIQGLDGRYTQILKDGFPLYSGAASGLGLLQTPPLDLKQVEVIKGSASTLYGGGAIAGLVNLISKTPTNKRQLRFHLNGISSKGFDMNGFYGQKFGKIGTTVFLSHNRNWAYAPSRTDFTAIPKFERYVINPKLFVYFNDHTKLNFGINTAVENRLGGDVEYIKGRGDSIHNYFEENKTQRYSTQLSFDHKIDDGNFINIKNSVSYFNRMINIPKYTFDGTQVSTFSEANYTHRKENTEWVTGVHLWTDNFKEKQFSEFLLRNYNQVTMGIFAQNLWRVTDWFNLEIGLRGDYIVDYDVVILPRISALFKITDKLSSRIGGGFGYKAPTIFTEESERIQYRNVLPIDKDLNKLEKSYGGNIDFNYRTKLSNKLNFSINQLFFYTYLNHPLMLEARLGNIFQFVNSSGHLDTKGTETNIKLKYQDFKLFLGYTYTDTGFYKNAIKTTNPLTPKHRINSVLMYEVENQWKIGLEAYYFSKQKLGDGAIGKQYWLCGLMAERIWGNLSIYINFENFLDSRQSKFDTIYTGAVNHPNFRDIYAPLDGFLVNGGIKFNL